MSGATSGRPLRFFALVMTVWTTMRVLNHPGSDPRWPLPQKLITLVEASNILRPQALVIDLPLMQGTPAARRWKPRSVFAYHTALIPKATATLDAEGDMPVDLREFIPSSVASSNRHFAHEPTYGQTVETVQAAPLLLHPSQQPSDRWHGSAWMLWRDNGNAAANVASVGRLGGSQVGLRIDYDLTPDRKSRTVAYARATAALQHPHSQEAAIGIAYQPTRAIPISVAVERRIALGEGGRNANAVLVVGGFGPTNVGPDIAAEGYAQAGMVGFNRKDLFIDGKLSLSKAIGDAPVRIGATVSGGAQPGVERIDIGPEYRSVLHRAVPRQD